MTMYPNNKLTPEWPQFPLWTGSEAETWVSMWQAAAEWTDKLGWSSLVTVPPTIPVKEDTTKPDKDRTE